MLFQLKYLSVLPVLLFDQWVRTGLGRADFLVNSIHVHSIEGGAAFG